jgi:hypothetical protein
MNMRWCAQVEMDGEVALVKADRIAGQYVLFDAGQNPGTAWTLYTAFAKLPATYNAPEALAISVVMRCSVKVGKEHGIFCGVAACADRPIVNTLVHFHERVKPRLDDNLLFHKCTRWTVTMGFPRVRTSRIRRWTARKRQWAAV